MTLHDHDDGDEDDSFDVSFVSADGSAAVRMRRGGICQIRMMVPRVRRIVGRDIVATFIIREPPHARRDHDPGDESEHATKLRMSNHGATWLP